MKRQILHTELCDLLGIQYPIIQAGMGMLQPYVPPVSTSPELVAAVSNAGGIGILGPSGVSPEEVAEYIKKTKALTDKPFGVDLIFAGSLSGTAVGNMQDLKNQIPPEYKALLKNLREKYEIPEVEVEPTIWRTMLDPKIARKQFEVVLEEKVPVMVSGLGTPPFVVSECHARGIKVLSAVGNLKTACRAAELGVDAIIVEGWGAGSHSGRIDNLVLIPPVVDAVKPIPVIAAGGIADGRQVAASLMLGAAGVWIGTRFLATPEAAIPDWYKQLIIQAGDEGTQKNAYWTGRLNRHYKSPVDEALETSGLKPLPMPLQGILTFDFMAGAIKAGKYELSGQLMGQGTAMIKELKPAAQIMAELVTEAVTALDRAGHFISKKN
jgi:nitronate monooxygenase